MKRLAIRIVAFGLLGFVASVFALQTDWHAGPRRNFRTGMFMLEYPAPSQNTVWTFFPITRWGVWEITTGNVGPESAGKFGEVAAERMAEEQEVPSWSVMR